MEDLTEKNMTPTIHYPRLRPLTTEQITGIAMAADSRITSFNKRHWPRRSIEHHAARARHLRRATEALEKLSAKIGLRGSNADAFWPIINDHLAWSS
jgi:hypothetical protein